MAPGLNTAQRMTGTDGPMSTWQRVRTYAAQYASFANDEDRQIERIRRIGKRMFGVSECVISLQPDSGIVDRTGGWESLEDVFCRSLPQPSAMRVIPDTLYDKKLRRHGMVKEAPYVRFYAAYPIRNTDGTAVGSISLIDYFPRDFNADDEEGLIDLARLVEAEIQARTMSAAQLELRKKNRSLRRKSLVDPLLEIWNRGAILRILNIEADRCDKAGRPLSLIVIDLDYFKRINDTYGHAAGDAALVKVAATLRSCIRSKEALGRYGGEEFLVVLPATSLENAMAVAERMRAAVECQPECIDGAMVNFTISAGVASTDTFPAATIDEMIHRADLALYAAKDAGRNLVMSASVDTN